jgi:hypothetical protein
MNKIARSNRREDVLRRQLAPEHARQPRGGSNIHIFIPVGLSVNETLSALERLEAENTQLRGSVVELMLQIQALRDGPTN